MNTITHGATYKSNSKRLQDHTACYHTCMTEILTSSTGTISSVSISVGCAVSGVRFSSHGVGGGRAVTSTEFSIIGKITSSALHPGAP